MGEIFLCLVSINSPTCFAHRGTRLKSKYLFVPDPISVVAVVGKLKLKIKNIVTIRSKGRRQAAVLVVVVETFINKILKY